MIGLKRKLELNVPEIVDRKVRYRRTMNGKTLQEKWVVEEAHIGFPYRLLTVKFRNEYGNPTTTELYTKYMDFLLGKEIEGDFSSLNKFSWQLEEPLQDIKHIERKVKLQVFIWKLYFLKKKVIRFYERISPALIFLLKCITFALILKLIL